jgi:hypothetical protein
VTKVFVSVTTSLDGYLAPPGRMEELDGPKMKEWTTQWSALNPGYSRSASSGRT